ncbi:aminotransferase class-V family protein, partial [Vibrio parahaemolyticus V-223/04]
TQPVISLI